MLCFLMITVSIIIGLTATKAEAATGLKIYNYNTKATSNYTGKQVKVTYNGAVISKSNTPGILVNGVAMQPYDDIFKSSGIAATCSYNTSKGTITISKSNKKIIMKIGSKSATVNGKTVKLSVAPIKMKYVAANKIKILVPSKLVSESLGLRSTWYSTKNTVAIVNPSLQISINNGATTSYTGAQAKATVNGKSINLTTMPNLLINGTTMVRARAVFADSTIKAGYNYDSAKKTITLKRDSKILVMTIGSKTALLNNVKKSMTEAPFLVTNKQTGKSYIMVPGSFTATSLGCSYAWSNATLTSAFTTTASNNDAELGDSGDPTETGVILNQWAEDKTKYSIATGIHELTQVNQITETGKISKVSHDTTNTKSNSETFLFESSTLLGNVTSSITGKKLTLQVNNTSCDDTTYQAQDMNSTLLNTITTTNKADTSGTTIELDLLKDNSQYDISYLADNKTLAVTVYTNTVISGVVGNNNDAEYLVLNGFDVLNATVAEASGSITITLPNCTNSLGDISADIQGSKYIKKVTSVTTAGNTQITLTMSGDYICTSKENGKQLTITLQPSKIPVVKDTSKYEIVVPLPDGVKANMISDEDYYYNKYFVIRLQGNHKSYFTDHKITNTSGSVSGITTSLNSSGNTEIKISTTSIQGYSLSVDGQNLYINVGNPSEIYKNIVVLDPGHGGVATGTMKDRIIEKNLNFKILYTVGKKYFDKDPAKLKVYYTRVGDYNISLADRGAFAKKVGADLFVSLHMNSAIGSTSAKGTEVYYSAANNKANKSGLTSKMFASSMVSNLSGAIGASNRGVKEAAYVVIKNNTVPAILIELGFLTNSTDYSIVTNEKKQDLAVKSMYNTLLKLFEKYPG